MNSQDFLTLNLVGAGAFLFWYLVSRGGSTRPTQLNMKAQDRGPVLLGAEKASSGSLPPKTTFPPPRDAQSAKMLNVMFNYNGHSWDAYEVLGVPAGASLKIVTEAYQTSIKRSTGNSVEFLETAYKAILHQHQNKK